MLNSAQFVQMAWLTLYPSPRWGCGQAPTPQFPVQLRELKPFVLLRIQDSIKFGPRARFNMLLLSYWRVMGVKMDSLWKLYSKSTQVTKDKMLASSLNVSSLRRKKKRLRGLWASKSSFQESDLMAALSDSAHKILLVFCKPWLTLWFSVWAKFNMPWL